VVDVELSLVKEEIELLLTNEADARLTVIEASFESSALVLVEVS
jgi:hypothetical protein